jgi:hypothetical protein
MNKSFWHSAVTHFIAFFVGVTLYALLYVHPFDECSNAHSSPDDILECVWLLQNN